MCHQFLWVPIPGNGSVSELFPAIAGGVVFRPNRAAQGVVEKETEELGSSVSSIACRNLLRAWGWCSRCRYIFIFVCRGSFVLVLRAYFIGFMLAIQVFLRMLVCKF